MCYVCSCFGWILDLIQRALTFCLSCIMSCVVCFGLAVVIAAGIAYGYNYMMAEFLTLARSDVFVYIRRGQFYEKADLKPHFARRSGANPNELFSSNSSDYQDTKPIDRDIKPLPNTWRKAIDRRNYAENLVSFAGNVKNQSLDSPGFVDAEQIRPTLPPSEQQMEPTVVLVRGPPTPTTPKPIRTSRKPQKIYITPDKFTTIVMRKFYPNPQITMVPEANNDDEFYQEADRPVMEHKPTVKDTMTDWPLPRHRKIIKKGKSKGRHLRPEHMKSGSAAEYGQDDEEDDVAYKPV